LWNLEVWNLEELRNFAEVLEVLKLEKLRKLWESFESRQTQGTWKLRTSLGTQQTSKPSFKPLKLGNSPGTETFSRSLETAQL